MTKKEMFKKLEPYLSDQKVLEGKEILREIVGRVPEDLFNIARFDLQMIKSSEKFDGDYSPLSNPEGHFMRWYVIQPKIEEIIK